MSKRCCANCYYINKCDGAETCEDYTPVDEQTIDEEVDDMIEDNRMVFYTECFEYI